MSAVAGPLIGSLCSGYGGLDMAVQAVLGGELAWVADIDPGASAILAHHHPAVPNLGDITAVSWSGVARVDVLTAGFPCQDVSSAGLRAGLAEGTRSGLWREVARAVRELTPSLVVIENVAGLRSARADGDVEPCPWCLGDGDRERAVRALGTVLADLADCGFDAEWASVRASDVGAAHQRERVFLLAWPSHPQGPRLPWPRLRGRFAERRLAASHPDRVGGDRDRARRPGRDEPAEHRLPAADPDRRGLPGHGEVQAERDTVRTGRGTDAGRHGPAAADTDHRGRRTDEPDLRPGQPDTDRSRDTAVDWSDYADAIRRWEKATGRPAPGPTDAAGRLSPVFVEWLMGLPAGHVTAVPVLTRTKQLKALGNGVLPAQAEHALRLLLDRATADAVPADQVDGVAA
ncbi:DNA cytosine methyltransferase [Kitasatospora sp. NPDC004615]|uniref:DNA cytosine methyltransferase n=1 Tax=Kitasatospora sp. NPDC004615 TaxID=3364017 RepID=UPI0036D03469